MIHGFPDFWYSWRKQMEALADRYQVVAIDQRGYNQSDQPKGVDSYEVRLLVGDVVAVIKSLGKSRATIVGHDWGGVVAWQFAVHLPRTSECERAGVYLLGTYLLHAYCVFAISNFEGAQAW
jgi:epoxide hydrolase 4